MCKQITLRKLVNILIKLGFEERRKGTHGIFRHKETGVIITLPLHLKEVPPIYIKNVFRQVIENGIATEEKLNDLLKQ